MSKLAQTVAELDQQRRVLVTQTTVLESVSRGEPLPDILLQLCTLIEGHSEGSLCSILLLEESSGTLRTAAGPSLPVEYANALDGIEPGEGAGSCGTAAARGEPVIVSDIGCDPLWDSFRELALRFGIRSCWSSPILGAGDAVLGTFAISHSDPREPTADQIALLQTASHLAGIALEREAMQRRSEQLQQELHKQQRLESLGVLAGGIAHDLNNMMTAILGNLTLAAETVTDAEALECLRAAEEACEQSKILSGRFLSFAKGGTSVRESVDLADVVRAAASFALAGSDLSLDWSAAGELPPVEGDRSELLQLVSNLLTNADQATPDGGTLRVSAGAKPLDEDEGLGLDPGLYVELAVADSGKGIAPEHLGRIFDPYFTLRQAGSGLGLATVHSIARGHGGHVRVESEPGKGTCFTVLLPAAREAARPVQAAPLAEGTREGRILVMDDEPAVLRVAGAFLERVGYGVETAANGEAAIELFEAARERGEPFSAAVLDLTVRRGMGGEATVRRLRAIDPGLAVVVASGYSAEDVLAAPDQHGFDSSVAKPFRREELLSSLERALEIRDR